MPKLVFTHREVTFALADKHNIDVDSIVIEPLTSLLTSPPPSVANYTLFFRDFLNGNKRDANGYHNKIGMIKAVRSITGLGLKEAKDIVEGI